VLIKDNIDTGDRMQTTAGSFALAGAPAPRDSTVAANLRAGGAVILGKTTCRNGRTSAPSPPSADGPGAAPDAQPVRDRPQPLRLQRRLRRGASANFAAVSLGTETDGSIVCPGNANGVVGIKPTVGLTSRAGVVPISHIQDTVGPHGRTVADAAAALA